MFKKVYWKLGLVVTLLLTVFLAFSLLAQAANASTNTLTVEYDSGCVAVRLYYKNGDAEISEVLQNGVPKEIPSGISNVRLVLELGDGYDVDVATDGEVEIFRPDDLIFDFGVGLTEDKTITVSTKPKVYDIVYIRTTEEGTANTDGFPTQHTYNTITEIPNPTLTGYNFVKWLILTDHPDNIPNFDPSNSNDELRPGSNAVSVSLPANKIPVDSARDTFYLYPVWTPKTYPVYCYDVIYSGYASDPFGGYLHGAVPYLVGEFPAGATFRGNDAAFVNNSVNHDYRGFWFDEAATLAIDKGTITVMAYETGATKQNTVYRYYTPYEYDIEYGCSTGSSTLTPADGSELPTTHVYNRNTDLPALVLTGYTFAGWKAEVFDGAVWVDVSSSLSPVGEIFRMYAGAVDSPSAFHSECSPDYEGRRVIRLTALWTALEYDVTYDFEGALDVVFPADQYGTYVFDTDLVIPNPVRRGYTFLGWTLTSGSLSGVEIDEENGFTTLPAATYTNGITLVARWQANTYQITFNGNGADSQWSPSPLYATFDQVFAFPSNFTFPTKLGHDFKGFSLDAAGTQMITNAAGSLLTPVWNIDADTVLYAQWEPRSYTVTITDSNGKLFDNTEITVNGQTYSGSGLTFRYGDTVTVVINVLRDGGSYRPFKLIAWQGVGDSAPQAIANAYTYTYTFTLGAGDTELVGVMAPIVTVPEIMVDYVDEKLVSNDGELPDGIYRISYGTISQLIEITNGKIYITDNEGQKTQYQLIRLDDSAFGSTVKIVVCGNGSTTADSDEILLAVNPRPAAPVLSATGEIKDVYAYEDTKIVVQMKVPVDLSKYEFAISDAHRINGNLIWYSGDALPSPGEGAVMFEHLRVGTPYYVYVRLKAVPGEHPTA